MDTATATPPLTHVRVDWEGFCWQLNGLTAEHRRKPSVRRETLSEETLIGTLRRFGYEFRDESFLEMPRLVRETLLNVANAGLSGVFPAVDFFIEAGMFDAGRAKAPKERHERPAVLSRFRRSTQPLHRRSSGHRRP